MQDRRPGEPKYTDEPSRWIHAHGRSLLRKREEIVAVH